MAAPDFLAYYWAVNIRAIVHWLYEDPGADAPSWYTLESSSCLTSSLSALVYGPVIASAADCTKNKVVKSTIKIWTQMRRHFGWLSLSLKSPTHTNHFFKPSLLDKTFTGWQEKGIKSFRDLYSEGVFSSFEQLCLKFRLPRSNFFRYLQARDFLHKTLTQFPALPPCSPCDALLERPPSFRGIISILYNKITLAHQSHLSHCKADWELDLSEDITEELWHCVCVCPEASSHILCLCQACCNTVQNPESCSLDKTEIVQTLPRC